MTSDERAQLIEDIKRSNKIREDIVQRAQDDEDFDLVAAWETLDELDTSIANRFENARRG
jgi:hypothetical protein